MTSQFVIIDDQTDREIQKGHEYYMVRIMHRNGGFTPETHYQSWSGVIEYLTRLGGNDEIIIKRTQQY